MATRSKAGLSGVYIDLGEDLNCLRFSPALVYRWEKRTSARSGDQPSKTTGAEAQEPIRDYPK